MLVVVSITETLQPGQFGFSLASSHQTSYGMREQGKDWTGNSVYLWAIAAAVYMSLLGPRGFREIGDLIISRSNYAARQLAAIGGVKVPFGGFFKEFVVDFSGSGRTVSAINEALRTRHRIFGGKDISGELDGYPNAALYCVTEVHTRDDIDRLAAAVEEVLS